MPRIDIGTKVRYGVPDKKEYVVNVIEFCNDGTSKVSLKKEGDVYSCLYHIPVEEVEVIPHEVIEAVARKEVT